MMSSSSATALVPPHPETAEHQPAAVDDRHPQQEGAAEHIEIADQGQHGDGKPDSDKGAAEPQARKHVEQHEIDRPEGAELARPEMTEHFSAEIAEGIEQDIGGNDAAVDGPHARSRIHEAADHKHACDAHKVHHGPDIAGVSGPEPGREIAGANQHAPPDHDEACQIIELRLLHAADDMLDIAECRGGLLAVDHVPAIPRLATSSAITETALGSLNRLM